MRGFFGLLGWLFAFGAVSRAGLAVFAAWLAATNESVGWDLDLRTLITDHLSFLNWSIDLAYSIFPAHFVNGIMALPAIIGLPIGAMVAAILAVIFFKLSRPRD